jgi:hypothetical protein
MVITWKKAEKGDPVPLVKTSVAEAWSPPLVNLRAKNNLGLVR